MQAISKLYLRGPYPKILSYCFSARKGEVVRTVSEDKSQGIRDAAEAWMSDRQRKREIPTNLCCPRALKGLPGQEAY